jgi:hypothetical protein
MASASTALLVIGVLLVLLGAGAIALDMMGHGDSSGLDYKDLGILGIGFVLLIIGAATRNPGKPAAVTPKV